MGTVFKDLYHLDNIVPGLMSSTFSPCVRFIPHNLNLLLSPPRRTTPKYYLRITPTNADHCSPTQPTLSFSSRKPSVSDTLSKPVSKAQSRSTASLAPSASEVSIPSTAPDSDVEPTPDAEERTLRETAREKGRKDAEDKEKARRGERRTLDPKSKEWEGLTREAKKAMGGMQPSEYFNSGMVRSSWSATS
jgi:hypothetical protein